MVGVRAGVFGLRYTGATSSLNVYRWSAGEGEWGVQVLGNEKWAMLRCISGRGVGVHQRFTFGTVFHLWTYCQSLYVSCVIKVNGPPTPGDTHLGHDTHLPHHSPKLAAMSFLCYLTWHTFFLWLCV